jgi:nucleoid-associated protein YgaU
MSSITATRTPRLTPPAAPTRKPVPRRRTAGQGAALVGGVDRPVLRIVASRRSSVERLSASVERRSASVESRSASVESRGPSVELVETTPHRVDLTDFFAPEYDGDDVTVEIVRPRPSSVRLTRRGRLVVFGASLAATLGLGFLAATGSLADDKPEPTRVVTVQPGQTLWDIAARASSGGDVRSTVAHLEAINHLDTTTLQAGQTLRVPR